MACHAPSQIIDQAIKWGHKAVAVTDHGDWYRHLQRLIILCRSFGESMRLKEKKLGFKAGRYGVEAYLVDDTKSIVTNPDGQDFSGEFVVFDLETTGFSALVDKVIEIGAVKYSKDGEDSRQIFYIC